MAKHGIISSLKEEKMDKPEEILKEIEYIKEFYKKLIDILPNFSIIDARLLPYGLKPHTRSISWIVEQVINQQSKVNASALGVSDVDFDLPDTSLHDCIITDLDGKKHFVNIKVHNADGDENKNDISAVEKLYVRYTNDQHYNLLYACLGVHFNNVNISFDKDYLEVFAAQFLPIYINPRNDKIQAFYRHEPQIRTRDEFLKLLEENSKSISLGPKGA